jgi:hypothetical protein
LIPPDPQLKGAWYPGGFNPRTYQVKNRFRNFPFQIHLAPLHFDEPWFFIPSLAGPSPERTLDWLLPLDENYAPPIGWHDASLYLIVPILTVASQYVSMNILQPPKVGAVYNSNPAETHGLKAPGFNWGLSSDIPVSSLCFQMWPIA